MNGNDWQALAFTLKGFDDTFPHRDTDMHKLLERMIRDARMRAAQMVAVCNYEWAQEPSYEKRIEDTRARLEKQGEELGRLWPGAKLELGSDPRGMVVRIIPPNKRGDCWAGGVGVA
jgi:hypothetical protein